MKLRKENTKENKPFLVNVKKSETGSVINYLRNHIIKSRSHKLPNVATILATWILVSSAQKGQNHTTSFN